MNNINIYQSKDGKKPWYKSKTIWFNVVTIALGFVQVINQTYAIPTQYMVYISAIGNVILRFVTDTKITTN